MSKFERNISKILRGSFILTHPLHVELKQIRLKLLIGFSFFFFVFRDFYADQLELITSIEDILVPKSEQTDDNRTAYQKRHERIVKILTIVSLIVNIVCFIVFLISFINSRLFFIKDPFYHQNRRCSYIQISLDHIFSC
jgi:hypothetical protein